jgi:hypothetical protein
MEEIRKIRNGECSDWKPFASELEDGARLEALKLFNGDFFFNQYFNKVSLENTKLQAENNSLKDRLSSAERALSQRNLQPRGV